MKSESSECMDEPRDDKGEIRVGLSVLPYRSGESETDVEGSIGDNNAVWRKKSGEHMAQGLNYALFAFGKFEYPILYPWDPVRDDRGVRTRLMKPKNNNQSTRLNENVDHDYERMA
jgi:hypothetical protein